MDDSGDSDDLDDSLVAAAREAVSAAYVPYSSFPVGAALETDDGAVYTGCNLEVANYSNSLHAEEVAVGAAVSDGAAGFDRLAVTSAARDGLTPCGMCRQTLSEFCDDDLVVVCDADDSVATYTLGELLPAAMGPETLGVE
ncbi:MAG: cytidine deaminase [Halobacteriaceae archaeon]